MFVESLVFYRDECIRKIFWKRLDLDDLVLDRPEIIELLAIYIIEDGFVAGLV
jgi:hypothetical protein